METYISLHHYESQEAAMVAAVAYQKENGGTILNNCFFEDTDDDGKIVGCYDAICVVQGFSEENPMGDSWETFPYNYTAL